MRALPMGPALRAVRDLVPAAAGCLAVTQQEWRTWAEPLQPSRAAYYQHLIGDPSSGTFEPDKHDLAEVPREERRQFVATVVSNMLQEVLGLDDLTGQHESTLADLGLDSFSAIGLRTRIRNFLGLAVPLEALVAKGTPDSLADALLDLHESSLSKGNAHG
jgi:acyl carrier protein